MASDHCHIKFVSARANHGSRASHPKAAVNVSDAMVALATTVPSVTAGCWAISSDGTRDQYFHVQDPSTIWLYIASGDAVEYCIEV